MKRLYAENVIDILPVESGFIFAVQQAAYDDKLIIAYKLYSFNTGVVSPVKKSAYLTAKFGKYYAAFEGRLTDYINFPAVLLPDGKTLVCADGGDASIYDKEGHELWHGNISYKDEGPRDMIMHDGRIWCSFPEGKAVSRYSAMTLKEELRFGGLGGAYEKPQGIFILDRNLMVCCSETRKIYTVDIDSYALDEYAAFDEPVYRYFKINSNEIVLLSSGIYRM